MSLILKINKKNGHTSGSMAVYAGAEKNLAGPRHHDIAVYGDFAGVWCRECGCAIYLQFILGYEKA